MSENKLDKPSQIQFAEAITENIPEADPSILKGLAAAYISVKAYKRAKKR